MATENLHDQTNESGPPCERIRLQTVERWDEGERRWRRYRQAYDAETGRWRDLCEVDEAGQELPRMGLVEHMRELLDLGQLDTPARLWGAVQSARLRADLGGGA